MSFSIRFVNLCLLFLSIRYFDLFIFIPNLIFLLFLLLKWIQSRSKLNPNKPLILTVTCLLLAITLTNLLRCTFVMIFSDQSFHAQEIIVKVSRRCSVESSIEQSLCRFFGYLFDSHFYGQN